MSESIIAKVWYAAKSKSERSLLPIPKHPEAQLYRRMTILSDAIGATVDAGIVHPAKLESFYTEVNQAKARAQAIDFDQLSQSEARDRAEEIADSLVVPTFRILYPNLGEKNG